MVDKVLFKKAEKKIAKAKTPREHAMAEERGSVTQRIKGKTYRLNYSIRRIRA